MACVFLIAVAFSLAIISGFWSHASCGFSAQDSTSDDEFCALLPDVPRDIALEVREVLVDATGWGRDEIHPNTRIVEFDLW